MDGGDLLFAMMFTVAMFCGVIIIFLALRQRSETLERQHRERMAMIERGQIPPVPPVRRGSASSLAMSLGIVTVGIGLALMTIIGIAAETPTVGVGVGGAIVIIGIAFIVRSLVVRPPEVVRAPQNEPGVPAAPPHEPL